MTLKCLKSRLGKIKAMYKDIDDNIEKMINGNPFVTDAAGVPASWLYKLVEEHLVTLCFAINPELENRETDVIYFISYYVWEGDFGGVIEVNGRDYNLFDDQGFMDYVKEGL